jgi:hypothetical protein
VRLQKLKMQVQKSVQSKSSCSPFEAPKPQRQLFSPGPGQGKYNPDPDQVNGRRCPVQRRSSRS